MILKREPIPWLALASAIANLKLAGLSQSNAVKLLNDMWSKVFFECRDGETQYFVQVGVKEKDDE